MFEFRNCARIMEFFIICSILSMSLVHGFTVDQCNCNCRLREHISRNVCDVIAEMMSKTDSNDLFLNRYAGDTRKIRSLAQNDVSSGEGSIENAFILYEDAGIKEPDNSEGAEKEPEIPFTELNWEEAFMHLKKRTDDLEKRSMNLEEDLASKLKRMESELLSKMQESLEQSLKVKDEILEPIQEAEKKSQKQTEELFVKIQLAENRSSEITEELLVKITEAEMRSLESEAGVLSKIQDLEYRSLKVDNILLIQTQQALEKSQDVLKKLLDVEKEFQDGLSTEEIERRNLEEKVNDTQTMARSMVASGMEACNAIQKKVSSSIENLTFYINNTVKDEMRSLHYELENIESKVKDCANSSLLVKLDKDLRVLENITKAELKSHVSELFLRVEETENKVTRLENGTETNTTLRKHSSEISEIWRRINSVETSQRSMLKNLTGSVTRLESEIDTLKNKTAVEVHQLSETSEKICPNTNTGWVDVGKDLCYLFVIESNLNWYEANFDCQTKGGVLASIHSEAESDLLRPYLGGKRKLLFIGLHRSLSNNDRFEWIDGSEVNYSNWRSNQPDNYRQKEACGELTASSMKWNDIHCDGTYGYICSARKIPKLLPSTLCPSTEWVEGCGQWCYFFETSSHRTWDDANYDCLRRGGALLIIHSEGEALILQHFVSKMSGSFWIGLRRNLTNRDRFVWVDGEEPSYIYWEENEPNQHQGKEENCVEMSAPSTQWNDISCHRKKAYICSSRKAKPF